MTEARPAPTPATDEPIAAARFALDCPVSGNDWAWRPEFVRSLIARIDAERAARLADSERHDRVEHRLVRAYEEERKGRLAAEARVKVLEEALHGVAATFDSYAALHDAKGTSEARVKAEANREHARKARAALKEPANG